MDVVDLTLPRILVCGSRAWTAVLPIRVALSKFPPGTTLIHGACNLAEFERSGLRIGADLLAEMVGQELGFHVLRFPADWAAFGKSAGPRRNAEMISKGRPTAVYAFHHDIESSRGTKDMLNRARTAMLPFRLFGGNRS